ncbi:MAG: hypothetical protein KAV00_09040, partial [Phycisphaerae bacterium]|nr:hypothetical protein [Phycisphaerae bacterium]
PSQTVWGQHKDKSAYEKLDQTKLAQTLRAFGMNELLVELVKSGSGSDMKSAAILVQAKIAAAANAKDQAGRDKLLNEAIAQLDKLIAATAKATDDKTKLQHYSFTLDRAVTEGSTKTAPYIEHLMSFQTKPGDTETVAKLTKSAVGILDRLTDQLGLLHEDWDEDDEKLITGVIWKLESLIEEVRYRGAWIRMYRAMALEGDSDERAMLLQQAISDVGGFAIAKDNSKGVKFYSLLLSGMCTRMLGEWHNAGSFLKRAADKDASAGVRLKAWFEMVVCAIDQKEFAKAQTAIENFIKNGHSLKVEKVDVDLQATLLKTHLLEVQAQALKKEDPAKSAKLLEESRKILLDFIEKYPAYRDQIMEILIGKYEGADTKDLPPSIRVLIGAREFTKAIRKAKAEKKKTPDFTNAEKIFTDIAKDKRAGKADHATALWYMGYIRNIQRRNDKAAHYFYQLAEKYPEDKRAKDSAMNAVNSLRGIVIEKKTTAAKLGKEFVEQYARCLALLVKGWGENDPKIRSYNYELGIMYDTLNRNNDAISAFNKVDPNSELYLPARSRVLSLQAEVLFKSKDPQEKREYLANNLIRDLGFYCRRARRYANEVAKKQPNKAKQVLGWGAECDMVIAQIHQDIRNQPVQSITHAEKIPQNWPELPDMRRRSQEFITRVLLESGQTDKAVALLLKLVEENPKGAETLIAEAIDKIHVHIRQLEFRHDAKSKKKLADLKKAYRVFSEELYKWALQEKKKKEQKNEKKEDIAAWMYGYRQALASAYESSGNIDEVKKSLEMFTQLDKAKSGQAMNIRGLARCYRRLGKNTEAMKQYDRLVGGLKQK